MSHKRSNRFRKQDPWAEYQTTALCFILHLLGDYVVQNALSPMLPSKRTHIVSMAIHALTASLPVGAYIGLQAHSWRTARRAILQCFATHMVIDSMFNFNKTITFKLVDQVLHIVSIHIIEVFCLRKVYTWICNIVNIM